MDTHHVSTSQYPGDKFHADHSNEYYHASANKTDWE